MDSPAAVHRDAHGNVVLSQMWLNGLLVDTTVDLFGVDYMS